MASRLLPGHSARKLSPVSRQNAADNPLTLDMSSSVIFALTKFAARRPAIAKGRYSQGLGLGLGLGARVNVRVSVRVRG